ncbi:hypothetical protein EVC11_018 [Rhizobium phage RHph_I20]|uniref:Uncharacterized protein n=1 Tax=Rhizobium phage RHph_I20 TaxID=2509730 RepID=A0A7S5RBI6_9CAUD|nr:hypothetical protein EVC11_018 [Rhizobium phage RHph_I20]
MTERRYRDLTQEELEALQAFAAEYGRQWKGVLSNVYWYNARVWRGGKPNDGYILHGLRNSLGPSWLDGFKLPKGGAE